MHVPQITQWVNWDSLLNWTEDKAWNRNPNISLYHVTIDEWIWFQSYFPQGHLMMHMTETLPWWNGSEGLCQSLSLSGHPHCEIISHYKTHQISRCPQAALQVRRPLLLMHHMYRIFLHIKEKNMGWFHSDYSETHNWKLLSPSTYISYWRWSWYVINVCKHKDIRQYLKLREN